MVKVKKSEIKMKNARYIMQGWWRQLMYSILYVAKARLHKYDKMVEKKKELCKECWEKGECVECGCEVVSLFFSDKPCSKGRF